jgi:hypothetical protein
MHADKKVSPAWLADAEDHDFPAAESYLSLICSSKRAAELTAKLRACKVAQFKAKDIFRASQLSLLGVSNSHVEKDKQKIANGKALSPLLLVRDGERQRRRRRWLSTPLRCLRVR